MTTSSEMEYIKIQIDHRELLSLMQISKYHYLMRKEDKTDWNTLPSLVHPFVGLIFQETNHTSETLVISDFKRLLEVIIHQRLQKVLTQLSGRFSYQIDLLCLQMMVYMLKMRHRICLDSGTPPMNLMF